MGRAAGCRQSTVLPAAGACRAAGACASGFCMHTKPCQLPGWAKVSGLLSAAQPTLGCAAQPTEDFLHPACFRLPAGRENNESLLGCRDLQQGSGTHRGSGMQLGAVLSRAPAGTRWDGRPCPFPSRLCTPKGCLRIPESNEKNDAVQDTGGLSSIPRPTALMLMYSPQVFLGGLTHSVLCWWWLQWRCSPCHTGCSRAGGLPAAGPRPRCSPSP